MTVSQLRPKQSNWTEAQYQARVDLAAAHRLAAMHGFNEGIFNHLTLAVPDADDRYYQIPFGLHWSEIRASDFMEIGYDGALKVGEHPELVERSGYCIHAPLHETVPTARAVLHTHMPFASSLAKLKDPRILPIGQTEVQMMIYTGYDMDYCGLALEPAEGYRLAKVIGDKRVLILHNHGVITIGETVASAYDKLYYLERVAQQQLYAMWTGRELAVMSDELVALTIDTHHRNWKYGEKSNSQHHFDALKRILDRRDESYKD
jgi:ribulose-5-phosphate 4-epimerase/fuculose-1-phosphate aldolase